MAEIFSSMDTSRFIYHVISRRAGKVHDLIFEHQDYPYDALIWCISRFGQRAYYENQNDCTWYWSGSAFCFCRPEDAVEFKLVWG